jgi:hypothetical protein
MSVKSKYPELHLNWLIPVAVLSKRHGSAAFRLLGLWVRIPPGSWMALSFGCCVLSGRDLLRQADHSSRGVLTNMVCLSVIMEAR